MIAMSEHYIVLNKCEVGEKVAELLSILRKTGCVDTIGEDAYRIRNASELDQQAIFAALENAMDKDFPPICEHCGNRPHECDCEEESPEVTAKPITIAQLSAYLAQKRIEVREQEPAISSSLTTLIEEIEAVIKQGENHE